MFSALLGLSGPLWSWNLNGYSIRATKSHDVVSVEIRDRARRLVSRFSDAGAEIERIVDLDADGKPEVIFELNGTPFQQDRRYIVFALGSVPKCLLDIDADLPEMEVIPRVYGEKTGEKALLFHLNFTASWIGPRGGAPFPVVFQFENGKLLESTRKVDWVVAVWKAGVEAARLPSSHPALEPASTYACIADYQWQLFTGKVAKSMSTTYSARARQVVSANGTKLKDLFDHRSSRWRFPKVYEALPPSPERRERKLLTP